VHNDIVGRYRSRLGTQEQRERWLPGYCTGEPITAIAITEPGAGSDLRGLRTVAALEGDHYVVNGQKTFISNGQLCDLVIVVARTEPGAGYRGLSLLVAERAGRASPAAVTSTRSGCRHRIRPNCSYPMCACPGRTCSAAAAPGSSR